MSQNVGQGEQRFNLPIYKSSHNSYDRDESLARQIDDYNVWQIELDIYDYLGELKVNHTCDALSIHEADTLSTLLTKMVAESQTYTSRFTIIYLDLKECSIANWGDDLNNRLKTTFIESLGQNSIYPSIEFIKKDESLWPSFQNLVKRGFHWCVIVDWHDKTPLDASTDPLFFSAISDFPNKSVHFDNTVLVCIDGGCNLSTTDIVPPPRDERWLYRAYPGGACASDCGQQNGQYWDNAVLKNYTLVASNCVDRSQTFDAKTHSPAPLFVNNTAAIQCPVDGESCEWGTHAFPFHSLAGAIERASPMVTLLIQSGIYQLRENGTGIIANKALVLRSANGIVRIT